MNIGNKITLKTLEPIRKIKKIFIFDSETDGMLREIAEYHGATQVGILRRIIREYYKQIFTRRGASS